MHIIDRRLNPSGKSLANRQRFLRRAKAVVQRAVRESFKDRSIKDVDQGGEISIVHESVHEPTFHPAVGSGNRDYVLPGNKEYVEGDRLPRSGGRGNAGPGGIGSGSENDQFRFVLTREEYLDLFLEDLELPNLAKRQLSETESQGVRRAGYTTSGSPSRLAITRTMRHSMSRRIALKRPTIADVEQLEEEIARLDRLGEETPELAELREKRDRMISRRNRIAYVDPLDLRYRRYEPHPKPIAQAVMFCLMDVSGSMTEHMKDLAKRFFALLHLFLTRCYRHVDIVFIRHTDRAEEVDEETFFYSTESGGTVVSSALEEMLTLAAARYRPEHWNIYVAQASDGDNMASDSLKAASLLKDAILPLAQYVAYLEVGREEDPMPSGSVPRRSDLWQTYEAIAATEPRFAMRKVWHRREIYPVFRELFRKQDAPGGAGGA